MFLKKNNSLKLILSLPIFQPLDYQILQHPDLVVVVVDFSVKKK